jgi:TfoX/Sxy family transcriptional regulator of competence genes
VAYDEDLAARVRALVASALGPGQGFTEQKMFGGLAFLVGGHMAVAASGQGGLLVRVEPDESAALIASGAAEPMEMGGRSMRGWLRVPASAVRTQRQLSRWVAVGVGFASTLEPKGEARGRPRR